MIARHIAARRASTLIVTLSILTTLSLLAAYMLVKVLPRVRMAYQNAAWQEARIAAESGVDTAMGDLIRNATALTAAPWTGWQEAPDAPASSSGKPPPKKLKNELEKDGDKKLAKEMEKIAKKAPKKGKAPVEPAEETAPVFLDNVKISTQGATRAEVDVQLWGLDAPTQAHSRWFRIRAMGTCGLPPVALTAPAYLEAQLRRFSLRSVRPSLLRDDVGRRSQVPLPSVSRTVEALVEPVMPFELAIWTNGSMRLAATGAWSVDSFDSDDLLASAGGLYPGRSSPATQENGHIASGSTHTFDALYGPTIVANGAAVKGAVATHGGDDPATPERENVSGAMRIDPARIRDDFTREMPMVNRPAIIAPLPPPLPGQPFRAGAQGSPAVYQIPTSLTQLSIAGPGDGTTGGLVLLIDGDLRLTAPLVVPPDVVAVFFVKGNLSFANSVNSGPASSNRAAQLMIFADGTTRQTLTATGRSTVTAAFYGPKTDVTVDGTVDFIGSLACGRFDVFGGGDGGIHYDRALADVGLPVGFRIVRYIEDVRQ